MRLSFGAACCFALAGCAAHPVIVPPPPISAYRDPSLDSAGMRRVVVLPTENETSLVQVDRRFREALATELRALGLFEVIAPSVEAFGCFPRHVLAQGELPPELVLQMARQFNADGLLLSSLKEYRPYQPPRIAATVHLVSTRDAVTLVSVDGTWDARDAAVGAYAQQYARQVSLPGGPAVPPDAVLYTPAYFEKLVAGQIAAAFAPPPPPPPAELTPERGASRHWGRRIDYHRYGRRLR